MTLLHNIPKDLHIFHQWVCAEKASKIPKQAATKQPASTTNPETWADFRTASEAVKSGKYDYLGFVFNDNGIVGIDIDFGYDDDGFLSEIATDIIGACESYTEKSRSGRGFHIIVSGDIPFKGKNNLSGVEIYKQSRYFILTGETLLYREIRANQGAIDYVIEKYFPETLKEKDSEATDRIYSPIWDVPEGGKIKLRPEYPRIPRGSRNICLTSLAGMLHTLGYDKNAIYREIAYANKTACDPPLDRNELISIVKSITRYKR